MKTFLIILVTFLITAALAIFGTYYYLTTFKKSTPTPTPTTNTQKSVLSDFASPKGEKIKIAGPQTNEKITSPLTISGEVRGTWSFEGSFPVILQDANGNILAQAPATLQGEWMTTEFVPFTVSILFTAPTTSTGKLILKKDNPSDNRALDDSLEIPVKF